MEATNPRMRRFREVDTRENFRPEDEASYYLGDSFEMGGVEFGQHRGRREEEDRNFTRFGERVWNENDYVGIGPRDRRKPDVDIFHEVCEALTDNPRLDATEIEVEVENGNVHLRGLVKGRGDKKEAERCIEFLPGVRDVMNELRF